MPLLRQMTGRVGYQHCRIMLQKNKLLRCTPSLNLQVLNFVPLAVDKTKGPKGYSEVSAVFTIVRDSSPVTFTCDHRIATRRLTPFFHNPHLSQLRFSLTITEELSNRKHFPKKLNVITNSVSCFFHAINSLVCFVTPAPDYHSRQNFQQCQDRNIGWEELRAVSWNRNRVRRMFQYR